MRKDRVRGMGVDVCHLKDGDQSNESSTKTKKTTRQTTFLILIYKYYIFL